MPLLSKYIADVRPVSEPWSLCHPHLRRRETLRPVEACRGLCCASAMAGRRITRMASIRSPMRAGVADAEAQLLECA